VQCVERRSNLTPDTVSSDRRVVLELVPPGERAADLCMDGVPLREVAKSDTRFSYLFGLDDAPQYV